MAKIDLERLETLQKKMVDAGLSALICRLPENVVYLTEYWPHHGFSFVVFPQSGKARLYIPEVELEYTDPDWADVTCFGWGLLKDGDLYQNYTRCLLLPIKSLVWQERKSLSSRALKSLRRPIVRPNRSSGKTLA